MTNREFAKENKSFHEACWRVEISPTARQASKFRRSLGKAFREGKNWRVKITDEGQVHIIGWKGKGKE